MKKKVLAGIALLYALFCMTGFSQATLTTIGTATYAGLDYKLIWDDNNNGNSVVWLDYSKTGNIRSWVSGLDGNLTYNINPGYTVDWGNNFWRLPATVDGKYILGWDGTTTGGYNVTNSEMGHLFYEELGNLGYYAINGTRPQPGYGLNNTGDFDNLIASWYWSGAAYAYFSTHAWGFNMNLGSQAASVRSTYGYGLAVRTGHVSSAPVPGAIWLLGSGIIVLAAMRRRKNENRI